MDKQHTAEEIRNKYIVAASKVSRTKRQKIVQMMENGATVAAARKAVDLPMMVVVQIIIQEFEGPFVICEFSPLRRTERKRRLPERSTQDEEI